MSGNCFPGSAAKKITCWADAWDENSSPFGDSEYLSDSGSQVSDSTIEESQTYDVKQSMRKLFQDQMYTDVTFYSKNNRKATIAAHRAILAVGSPLFAKMLFSKESEVPVPLLVEISNLPFEAFTCIVKYLYTGEIFLESDANAQAILDGAKQFEISSLVWQCHLYFQSQELTERNVCSKFQTSLSNKIEIMKNRCVEYIQENIHQVTNSADFLKCNSNTVRTICRLQDLNIREVDLLHAVMRWWNNQNVPDNTMLKGPLIKCFRFLTFTVHEFGDILKRYPNLMSVSDGLKIVLYLSNPPKTPDFKSLPSWINTTCIKRCITTQNPCGVRSENIPQLDIPPPVGKIVIPLGRTLGAQIVTELTSLLQMRCISGFHEIKAIKLSFQPPISVKSVIRNIDIKVHVHPCNLNVYEHIEVANSLEVTVTFSRSVKVRRGDLIDIEVEARNMQFYRFLQFDETCCMPENPHFQCCVSSRPKCGRLYFIKEVEYGPQENPKVGQSRRNRRRPYMKSMPLC